MMAMDAANAIAMKALFRQKLAEINRRNTSKQRKHLCFAREWLSDRCGYSRRRRLFMCAFHSLCGLLCIKT